MLKFIRKIADIDHLVYNFVDEGSKAGLLGTSFLHMAVVAGLFILGGVVAQGIVWVVTLPLFVSVFATLVGCFALYLYGEREFHYTTGDFWGYWKERDWMGMLDSILDFLAPLVALLVLLYFLWM